MSASSIVIKVKFKETLRRFIAYIEDEDEKLVLDVAMLREKIRGFFSFDSGVEFSMTYVDEDGDNVTLVDDDDLIDIVQQSLDPLRITVKLNKSHSGEASQTSSSLKSRLPFEFETLNRIFKFPGKTPEVGSLNSKKEEVQVKKATGDVKFNDVSQHKNGVDLHVPYFQPYQAPISATTGVVEGFTGKNEEVTDGVEKKKEDSGSEKKTESQQKNQMRTKMDFTFSIPNDSGNSSGMFKATNKIQCVASPNYGDYVIKNTPGKFQNGVRCNVCGVTPLTGDWFKSRVKENYNLCRSCIYGKGKQSPYPFFPVPPPTLPQVLQNRMSSDVFGSKLNSGFLVDVNVPDGTIMSPSTKFTKIWRMWNNGPFVWPQGTHLQWVSGDRLGSSVSVNVEIPLFGLPVNKELDLAVNFIAPELPGSYVSYWRMASPSGQKFGQQIWVMIEVENVSVKESGETSIYLNLPPVVKNHDEIVIQDPENNLSKVTDFDATSVNSKDNEQEMNLPIYDSVIDDDNEDVDEDEVLTHSPAEVAAVSSLFDATKMETTLSSLPEGLDTEVVNQDSGVTMDSSVIPATIVSSAPSSATTAAVQPSSSSSQGISSDVEQLLLEDLEDMGFDQVDLNREILRRNNYDIVKSIDDLCDVSEWDPMLYELEEMMKKQTGSF